MTENRLLDGSNSLFGERVVTPQRFGNHLVNQSQVSQLRGSDL